MLAVVDESEKNVLIHSAAIWWNDLCEVFFFVQKIDFRRRVKAPPAKMIDFHSRLHSGGAPVRW